MHRRQYAFTVGHPVVHVHVEASGELNWTGWISCPPQACFHGKSTAAVSLRMTAGWDVGGRLGGPPLRLVLLRHLIYFQAFGRSCIYNLQKIQLKFHFQTSVTWSHRVNRQSSASAPSHTPILLLGILCPTAFALHSNDSTSLILDRLSASAFIDWRSGILSAITYHDK